MLKNLQDFALVLQHALEMKHLVFFINNNPLCLQTGKWNTTFLNLYQIKANYNPFRNDNDRYTFITLPFWIIIANYKCFISVDILYNLNL